MKERTRILTLTAMFTALAYVVAAVARIPISTLPFLKYDPKDVILAICGFLLGPIPALGATAAASLIEMITVGTTGFIGLAMNILSSASFACVAAWVYRKKHTLVGACIGLVLGVAAMTAVMLLWNYFVTPIYMGYPREAVAAMLAPVFLPFNLIKGGVNAAITVLVYKPVSTALKRAHLIHSASGAQKGKVAVGAYIVAVFVLITCIFAILTVKGII